MSTVFPVLILLVGLQGPPCQDVVAGRTAALAVAGTRPTYLKNGTTADVAFCVDDGGRGLRHDVAATDGRHAQMAEPGEDLAADQTNLFDQPTVRVYTKDAAGRWICVYTKHLSYIAIPGLIAPDPDSWVWDGKSLKTK